MKEYVEKSALIETMSRNSITEKITFADGKSIIETVREFPVADVVEVVPELRKAVRLLHKVYEKAKKAPHVRDPLAYALYQVWKAMDRRADS